MATEFIAIYYHMQLRKWFCYRIIQLYIFQDIGKVRKEEEEKKKKKDCDQFINCHNRGIRWYGMQDFLSVGIRF